MLKMHPSITMERIVVAIEHSLHELSSPGICVACGEDADGVEPDARRYRCDACDALSVYGCEELLMAVAH